MPRNNSVPTEDGVFLVLGLLKVRLPAPWWWHGDDIETAQARGSIFRAYREANGLDIAYLVAVDVTADPTEPDIAPLTKLDIPQVDERLHAGIRRAMEPIEMTRWMASHLNEASTPKVLTTAYIGRDHGKERQYCRGTLQLAGPEADRDGLF